MPTPLKRLMPLVCGLLTLTATFLAPAQDLPPDTDYVVVQDGHLSLGGERVRFWGAIGSLVGKQQTVAGDPYYVQRRNVQRIKEMEFNMVRFWHYGGDDSYTKGDLSRTDLTDFFLAECYRNGIRVWTAGLGGGGDPTIAELTERVDKIDDPATREAWLAGAAALPTRTRKGQEPYVFMRECLPVAWDSRLEAIAIDEMKRKAEHRNLHTGLRYADDPMNAIWEITNEQWWIRRMTGGQWLKYPPYFRESLVKQWHAFLAQKYGDEPGLRKAWGFLLDGESLSNGTVLLAPMVNKTQAVTLNDTNPQALAAFENVDQAYGREDFTRQRGADVVEFFTGLIVAHKQRWAAALKTWGKSCALSPVLFDTGIGYNASSQYLHQQADAVSHCAYMEGYSLADPKSERYPFYSRLDAPPRLCNDVPWLEHNRMEGKPFLCYETQIGNPGKYRAEFPYQLMTLGSIQDWDAACWHYWHMDHYDYTEEEPYHGKISFPGTGAYQYDYTRDEVSQSAMRNAGLMFRNFAIPPAPKPTTYTYGKRYLYDPDLMDYAGSYGDRGWNMLDTTYRYGVRLLIDPTLGDDPTDSRFLKADGKLDEKLLAQVRREGLMVDGPEIKFNGHDKPNPISPNDAITFNLKKSCLLLDSPKAAGYIGFFAQYGAPAVSFTHSGLSLSDIQLVNPAGSPYPVTEAEKYVAFSITAMDGKSLDTTSKATISLVSTSFNSDLKVEPDEKGKSNWGKPPVLTTRVGATLKGAAIEGMRYVMVDYHMRELSTGTVAEQGLVIPADQPVFMITLTR